MAFIVITKNIKIPFVITYVDTKKNKKKLKRGFPRTLLLMSASPAMGGWRLEAILVVGYCRI